MTESKCYGFSIANNDPNKGKILQAFSDVFAVLESPDNLKLPNQEAYVCKLDDLQLKDIKNDCDVNRIGLHEIKCTFS